MTSILELEIEKPAATGNSKPPRERSARLAQPSRVPAETLKRLSVLAPARAGLHIAAEWLGIFAAAGLCEALCHPLLFAVCVMWIGSRQHALAIMMHDGSHHRLLPGKFLNDCASDLLLAWPLFITTRAYRENHLAHHRHTNTEHDPDLRRKQDDDWVFPKSWPSLAWILLKDVLALNTHQQFMAVSHLSGAPKAARNRAYAFARLAYYAAFAAIITRFELWPAFLLFWIVPMLTWLKMVLRVRSIAEHFAVENDHELTASRTVYPSLWERLFVAPKNVQYHLDHHLYPSVPFYRLKQLHAALLANPEFRARAHITQTYLGVLRECVQSGGAARQNLPPIQGATRS